MDSRERYYATTHYGDRDRLYHWEMRAYAETVRRCREQGLPDDSDWRSYGGYDRFEVAPVSVGLCPAFERETLEEDDTHGVCDLVPERQLALTPGPSPSQGEGCGSLVDLCPVALDAPTG